MAPTEPIRLVPLSDTQLAEFAVNGLLVLPLSLPPAFLERFYDRSRTLVEAELDRAAVWRQIDADVNAIAADPVLQGALTSILGPDFVMPPNGTLHSGLMQDQGFHRDGVDQCVCCQRLYTTVRDHRPRKVLAFVYPTEVTIDMGPTAVVPRSHILGIDRAGFRESEDRLERDLIPPHPARGEASRAAWAEKHAAASRLTNHPDLALRDKSRVSAMKDLLGDDTLEETFVTVPAGTVVICHMDLFHRASRISGEAPWRPMIKLAAARMSEPLAMPGVYGVAAGQLTRTWTDLSSPNSVSVEQLHREQLRLGTTAANYICHAAVRDFFAGRRAVDSAQSHLSTLAKLQLTVDSSTAGSRAASSQSSLMSVTVLEKLVIDSQSELGRLSSAYTLGYMVATGDNSALMALLALAQGTVERGRRAAWYGLTVGGPLACDALLQLLPEMSSELAMNAAHALGQAAAPVATAEDHARAVAICHALMARLEHTRSELLEYSGGFVKLEDTGGTNRPILPDFFATDRRRVLAECMASLALLTQHAIRFRSDPNSATGSIEPAKLSAANRALAVAAAEALLPLLLEPEPGAAFPSYMAPECCRWNAANALLRICSAGTEGVSRPSVPTFRGANQVTAAPGTHTVGGMVAEARRRLELPSWPTSGRAALQTRLASVQWPYVEATMESPYVDPVHLALRNGMGTLETNVISRL